MPAVNDTLLVSLGTHTHGLRTINVARCTAITDEGVLALARGCPLLNRASFAGCHRLTAAAVQARALSICIPVCFHMHS